jgi:hypothetical protein
MVIVVDLEPLDTNSCNILGVVPCEEDIIVKVVISDIDGTVQRRRQLKWNVGSVFPIATRMPLLQNFTFFFAACS